jgi:heme/copper-type cytochrome/quinol oxidase subunit 2
MSILRNPIANLAALALPVAALVLLRMASFAVAQTAIDVSIKNHQFSPPEIHVPAHQPATLNIKNEDSLAEEFDSTALKVEKVIGGGQQGAVHLRPLDPGHYPFMGEYHSDSAQGVVVAE